MKLADKRARCKKKNQPNYIVSKKKRKGEHNEMSSLSTILLLKVCKMKCVLNVSQKLNIINDLYTGDFGLRTMPSRYKHCNIMPYRSL